MELVKTKMETVPLSPLASFLNCVLPKQRFGQGTARLISKWSNLSLEKIYLICGHSISAPQPNIIHHIIKSNLPKKSLKMQTRSFPSPGAAGCISFPEPGSSSSLARQGLVWQRPCVHSYDLFSSFVPLVLLKKEEEGGRAQEPRLPEQAVWAQEPHSALPTEDARTEMHTHSHSLRLSKSEILLKWW